MEVLYFTTQPVGRPVAGFRDGEEVEDYSTEKTADESRASLQPGCCLEICEEDFGGACRRTMM